MRTRLGRVEVSATIPFLVLATGLAIWAPGWLGCIALAIAVHEGGHLLVMGIYRRPVLELRFSLRGILLRTSPGRGERAVLLAGTAANLLCGALLLRNRPDWAAVQWIVGGLQLLPIDGRDGGRLFKE